MKTLKILSVKHVGRRQTYNLCMKKKQHNFILSNGVVSGNSHAVAYSFVTYWTAYLKAHFPIEFYASLISLESKPERIIQYSSSARERGIKILPPDINKSGVFHQPEDGCIRYGLSHIKGMPETFVKELVRIRDEL